MVGLHPGGLPDVSGTLVTLHHEGAPMKSMMYGCLLRVAACSGGAGADGSSFTSIPVPPAHPSDFTVCLD